MKVSLGILFFLSLLTSCIDSQYSSSATFEVTNLTTTSIDSVLVQPDKGKSNCFSLEPNMTKQVTINLSGLSDGAYGVTYKIGDKKFGSAFGYFSNGMNLDTINKIHIYQDTVIYKTQ